MQLNQEVLYKGDRAVTDISWMQGPRTAETARAFWSTSVSEIGQLDEQGA